MRKGVSFGDGMVRKTDDERIIFCSTMEGASWGGSEELWSRTAKVLASQGYPVSASIPEAAALHPCVRDLAENGIDLWPRSQCYSLRQHPIRRVAARQVGVLVYEVARLLRRRPPAVVVFSDGGPLPSIGLLEFAVEHNIPFITIGHANSDGNWLPDAIADRYRRVLKSALRCYFVSHANLQLTETHIGGTLDNAEVVWNPVNLPNGVAPAWPEVGSDGSINFACVGRLQPQSKGQDILLQALAGELWRDRRWQLSFYGEGPMRDGLERLSQKLGIADRVSFAGFVPTDQIWATNHVLVMPSRYEGLPLAIVEAMLCGRPVIATDVAGHAEVIDDDNTGFLADAPTVGSVRLALERFWARRGDAEAIGRAGALRIRQLMPVDPIRVFSEKLKLLAGLST
jgi:glycosyltransferase involved in cell wall biosynthesis